jgi:endonuclease/exonuclease/phosphatase family metal-dependent hydrolase
MSRDRVRTAALALLAPLLFLALTSMACQPPERPVTATAAVRTDYLFCHWNVENFFDDRDDHRKQPGDREYDGWFADNPAILKEKLAHLSEALVKLNDGRGPDILGIVEVESIRAAELLRDALNARLGDPALVYKNILMKEVSGGRHIAPAIITRLPVKGDRTRLHGRLQRILEGHIVVEGQELVIFETHWTSRLRKTSEHGREDYANKIYGAFRAMYKRNPEVDVLIAGDFNDTPEDVSVTKHLHATGDIEAVRRGGEEPVLLNLFGDKNPKTFGTHYYSGWLIFDQIVVSPGMLDGRGWSCDPQSVRTVNTLYRPGDRVKRPWRFGGEHDRYKRGYSDHFPVTVQLRVNAG